MALRAAFLAALAFTLAVLYGCGGNAAPPAPGASSAPAGPNVPLANSPIKHVVLIVQENRSFDNLFYGFPGADATPPTTLTSVPLEAGQDVCHFHASFEAAYDRGKLDGFDNEQLCGITNGSYQPQGASHYMYAYVPHSELQPYWNLAQQYTLADRMFQSNSGPSFAAHQYLVAGQSDFAADIPTGSPWGCDAPAGTTVPAIAANGSETADGPFPCFDYTSLADELDAASTSWSYYAPALDTPAGGQWTAYDAVRSIRYGPDWTTRIYNPETQILSDVSAGKLAAVTWVIPSMPNSDHPLSRSNTGPDWVASVVNTIGNSPFWSSTAILIVWDDWGGWYDHVRPQQIDRMGLGFRVPLIIVSPYAKRGYVSHSQHEFGSILKFIEEDFDLPSLGQADARADDLLDCFDFNQSVKPFATIRARHPASFFIHERHVSGPNDPA